MAGAVHDVQAAGAVRAGPGDRVDVLLVAGFGVVHAGESLERVEPFTPNA